MARELGAPAEAFKRLKRGTETCKTVQAQLNSVVSFLAVYGHKNLNPHLDEAWCAQGVGTRPGKLQIFIWTNTVFGDDLLLCTGPSYEPLLLLGADIPSHTEVGIYTLALVGQIKEAQLSGMVRATTRAADHATPTARVTGRRIADAQRAAAEADRVAAEAERDAQAAAHRAEETRRQADITAAKKAEAAAKRAEKKAVVTQAAAVAEVKAEKAEERAVAVAEKIADSPDESKDMDDAKNFLGDLAKMFGM